MRIKYALKTITIENGDIIPVEPFIYTVLKTNEDMSYVKTQDDWYLEIRTEVLIKYKKMCYAASANRYR